MSKMSGDFVPLFCNSDFHDKSSKYRVLSTAAVPAAAKGMASFAPVRDATASGTGKRFLRENSLRGLSWLSCAF
jgi:hypothetical protein